MAGHYDKAKTQAALAKTLNIRAYDNGALVGCSRILSAGYYFGTITELPVLADYRRQGIGGNLLQLAKEHTPTRLYLGAQPGVEHFYAKNNRSKSLQSFIIEKQI